MLNFDMTIREYLVEKTRIAERKAIKRDMKKLEKQRDELEMLRKEEEVRRKEEEVRRKEEEVRRKEEEARRNVAEAKQKIFIQNLYKKGLSIEMIADAMLEPLSLVQKIIDEFDNNATEAIVKE